MIAVEEFQADAAAWLGSQPTARAARLRGDLPAGSRRAGLDWQRRLTDAGYAGIHWPIEHGGRGLTAEHNGAWLLECARAGVPAVFNMVGFVLTGGAIMRYGTAEQQSAHLRATLATEHVWCQLFSEPGAGSDLGSLSTRAELDGERYVVNGQKVWCSGGRYSNWGILMARTRPLEDAPKHDGISFFLCPMDLPGIEVRPLRQMTGEAEFDEVFFTDVELPADCLLGPLHGGWGVGMAVLTSERGHIGTSVIGLERRLDQMAHLAEGRDLTVVERQSLATLLASGTSMKAMAQRQGPVASTAASLMKLGITEMMFDVAMLRGDLDGAGGDDRGSERRRHVGRSGWPNRRRLQPGAAQHHRRTPPRSPPRTQDPESVTSGVRHQE